MRNCSLFLFLMLFALRANAQLLAYAGIDTVWCMTANGVAPRLGGNPAATGGTPPYNYEWRIAGQASPATGILDSSNAPRPRLMQTPSNADSLAFVLRVADALNAVAFDTVIVAFSRWVFTTADCRLFKAAADTVTLSPNGWSNFPPVYRTWVPPFSLSSDTANHPRSWTPNNTVYTASAIDRKGCATSSQCSVTVWPASVEKMSTAVQPVRFIPNPLTPDSRIDIPSSLENSRLLVFSIDGRLLNTLHLSAPSTPVGSLASLPPGTYFYRIEKSGNPPYTGKLTVKQ